MSVLVLYENLVQSCQEGRRSRLITRRRENSMSSTRSPSTAIVPFSIRDSELNSPSSFFTCLTDLSGTHEVKNENFLSRWGPVRIRRVCCFESLIFSPLLLPSRFVVPSYGSEYAALISTLSGSVGRVGRREEKRQTRLVPTAHASLLTRRETGVKIKHRGNTNKRD